MSSNSDRVLLLWDVKFVTTIVGIVEMSIIFIGGIMFVFLSFSTINLILTTVEIILYLIVVICLNKGITDNVGKWIVPIIVLNCLTMVGVIVNLVFASLGWSGPTGFTGTEGIVSSLLALLLWSVFTFVLIRCYRVSD